MWGRFCKYMLVALAILSVALDCRVLGERPQLEVQSRSLQPDAPSELDRAALGDVPVKATTNRPTQRKDTSTHAPWKTCVEPNYTTPGLQCCEEERARWDKWEKSQTLANYTRDPVGSFITWFDLTAKLGNCMNAAFKASEDSRFTAWVTQEDGKVVLDDPMVIDPFHTFDVRVLPLEVPREQQDWQDQEGKQYVGRREMPAFLDGVCCLKPFTFSINRYVGTSTPKLKSVRCKQNAMVRGLYADDESGATDDPWVDASFFRKQLADGTLIDEPEVELADEGPNFNFTDAKYLNTIPLKDFKFGAKNAKTTFLAPGNATVLSQASFLEIVNAGTTDEPFAAPCRSLRLSYYYGVLSLVGEAGNRQPSHELMPMPHSGLLHYDFENATLWSLIRDRPILMVVEFVCSTLDKPGLVEDAPPADIKGPSQGEANFSACRHMDINGRDGFRSMGGRPVNGLLVLDNAEWISAEQKGESLLFLEMPPKSRAAGLSSNSGLLGFFAAAATAIACLDSL